MRFQIFVSTVLIGFLSAVYATCPTTKRDGNLAVLKLVKEVAWPGLQFKPSTSKLLRVLELNNASLRGHLTPFSGGGVYFMSTCSGLVRVWRADGTTIIEHDHVSQKNGLHFANIEGHTFVYDSKQESRTYRLPEHRRSRREAQEEYNKRNIRDHPTDEGEVNTALDELIADPDVRLLAKLSEALGEAGIYGHQSPCSLPLHVTAMSIARHLPRNASDLEEDEESDCSEHTDEQLSPRVRRGWWWKRSRSCKSLTGNPDRNNCLGMCGKGCSCWKRVCGDCCWHRGCYEHDLCCGRKKGKISCWIPLGFKCSSYAQYPRCL